MKSLQVGRRARTSLPESPPLVVVGAHRSGTSITTQMLAELGVFVGKRLDQNSEATYIQRLNRRILDEVGAHWSTPLLANEILERLREDGTLRSLSQSIGEYFGGPLFDLEYWGSWSGRSRPTSWGWKDPRNLLVMPVYEELFPSLRIVWVRRHPFDTARSLIARESRREHDFADLANGRSLRDEAGRAVRLIRGMPLASPAWRTGSLRGAVEISLEYAELHERIVPTLPHDVLTIEYHDLVGDSMATARRMADFLPGDAGSTAIAAAAARPHPASSGYRSDEVLVEFAEGEFADRLAALGYPS